MRTIDQMIQQEVNCCLSSIVSTLASGYGEDIKSRDLSGMTEQAFELACPIDDYEEAATQEGWTGPFRDEFGAQYFKDETDGQTWTCVSWQALCDEFEIEPYQWEVYEFWAISSWFAEKLAAAGEKVDTDFAGLNVWARTTTGQAISMDGVVQRIYAEMMAA